MTDSLNSILSIDLSDGTQFRFANLGEISSWIAKEEAAFRWLIEGGAQAGSGVANLRNTFLNSMNNVKQYFNQWQANPDNDTLKQQFANVFRSAYAPNTSVCSDHQFAKIATEVAAKDGVIAASAAFGTLLGIDSQISFATIKGIIEAILKRDGIDPGSPAIVATTIADLNSSASADRVKNAAEWSGIAEHSRTLLETIDQSFKAQTADFNTRSDEIAGRVNDSVKSIKDTESAYKEQMNLQASVEYWNAKGLVIGTQSSGHDRLSSFSHCSAASC